MAEYGEPVEVETPYDIIKAPQFSSVADCFVAYHREVANIVPDDVHRLFHRRKYNHYTLEELRHLEKLHEAIRILEIEPRKQMLDMCIRAAQDDIEVDPRTLFNLITEVDDLSDKHGELFHNITEFDPFPQEPSRQDIEGRYEDLMRIWDVKKFGAGGDIVRQSLKNARIDLLIEVENPSQDSNQNSNQNSSQDVSPPKRKRGRPRKDTSADEPPPPKRKRGRPRKHPIEAGPPSTQHTGEGEPQAKRAKHSPEDIETKIKRHMLPSGNRPSDDKASTRRSARGPRSDSVVR